MQKMATEVSLTRSLVTTLIKISIYIKYVKLVLDISTEVGLMSHKKEVSAQSRAGRKMKRENQRERYRLHSPKQVRIALFLLLWLLSFYFVWGFLLCFGIFLWFLV